MDEDDESVGLGFAGSTFRHAVNNQRPEVQRANRRGFFNGMKATFKNPGDIPTSPSSAAQKGLELGVTMRKHGDGSQGMGNWDEMDEDDESVGLGFAGSTFRHAVNNQRPEVQRANRRGFFNGMKATFKNPGDIPTSPSSAAQKGLELGVNMRKHGYGSQGMGNWDELDEDDESVGFVDERLSHIRAHRPTGKSVRDWI